MKTILLLIFILVLNVFFSTAYSLNNDFTKGYSNTFQTQNNNTFNQNFSNPNSYMNKSKYTGTTQPLPAPQHSIFNYDTTRYNSNCQFGVCMPGGH